MPNHTDFNVDFNQDIDSPYLDFPSEESPDTLRGFNPFPTNTHQTTLNPTFSVDVTSQNQYYPTLNQNYNWIDQGFVNYVPADDDERLREALSRLPALSRERPLVDLLPGSNMATEMPAITVPTESINTTGYNMATEVTAYTPPTESGNPTSHRPELRCSIPGCPQDRTFPSESALRKHEAKHSKSHICYVPGCKHTQFGDKSGLDRHNREVHGSQTYYCPITSCKRQVRGFSRRYNLVEHLRRCHTPQPPNSIAVSILGRQNYTGDSTKGQRESYGRRSPSQIVAGGSERLREKLANLHDMREKIDIDIEAVERNLDLLGEDYS